MGRPLTPFLERLGRQLIPMPYKQGDYCYHWVGAATSTGYGRISTNPDYEFKTQLVHRQVYQRVHGAISDTLEVDHICKNRRCCNPKHLRLLTKSENLSNRTFKRSSN